MSDKNGSTFKRIHDMKGLSDKAREMLVTTSGQMVDEIFGSFKTAEEVNAFAEEYYTEEEDKILDN